MTVTPIDLKGFEYESLSTSALTGFNPPFNTVLNAAAITFVAGRTGGKALQVAQDATNITAAERSIGTTRTAAVVGFAFKVSSTPATNAQLFRIAHNAGLSSALRIKTDGTLQAGYSDGTSQQGTTFVCDGAWHWVTMYVNVVANPNAIDWALDGVAQTSTSKGQAATTVLSYRFGNSTASHDLTALYDDFVISETPGDYPVSPHVIYGMMPNGDGTHNLNAHIAGDAGETTNLYQKVDEQPPNATDYIKQTVIGASDYAELTLPNTSFAGVVPAARIYLGALAAGTGANNVSVRLVDSGGTTIQNFAPVTNFTAVRFAAAPITAPGGGWNATVLDGMKVRVGFSSDVIDVPYVSSIMVEYAVMVPADLPATAGLIAVAGGAATLTISLPATAGTVALAGGAATLAAALAATAGTLAIEGGAATLSVVRYLPATAGELVLAGGIALLSVSLATTAGQIAVAGGSATLRVDLAATAGTVALAGGVATPGIGLPATAGQVSVEGGSVSLTISLAASAGQVVFSGGVTSLGAAVGATAGTLAIEGGTATLAPGLQATAGELVISGGTASLTIGLTATAGPVVIEGGTATVAQPTVLTASAGSVVLAGGSATLSIALAVSAGSIVIEGGTAALGGTTNLSATAGLVTVEGGTATLTIGVPASAGELRIQGAQAALAWLIQAGAGTITISGGSATLGMGGTPTAPHEVTARRRDATTGVKGRDSTVVAVARGS